MASLYKKIILIWLIFCSSLALADGETTYISISSNSLNESSAGTQKMEFRVTLSQMTFGTTVTYTTHNGSAEAGSDYIAQSGTLTYWPGETEETIEIDILDDSIYEGNEYFYIQIATSESGYAVSDSGRGYGTIIDNEHPPLELYLHNRSESETDSNRILQFTARLNQPAPMGGVTVTYTTEDDSAIAGSDYTATSGTLTIPEGQINGYIDVETIGDTIPEGTELFKVKILSISTGTLSKAEATCTLWDDDAIKVDISSSDVYEGDVGDSNAMPFRIFLHKAYPNTTPLTISYQTQDGSHPSATANLDYIPMTGSVTFNQGDIEKFVHVPIIGDNEIEPDENLKMIISGSGYIIDTDSESEILHDDGSYPGVNVNTTPFSIIEGNSSTRTLNFHFTLDKPALAGTSFEYYTQDDEASTADNDYIAIPVTTYTIPEGETQIDIPVTIIGDRRIENDETFLLKIQNEVHLNVTGHTAEGIIINDDGSYPVISFNSSDFSAMEGDSGKKDINFTFTLDKPAVAGSGFDYYTQDGTAQSSDHDYKAITTKRFDIPIGATQFMIPVEINGDTTIENDEQFKLLITNESNLTINGNNFATGTIVNDDGSLPKISISAPIHAGNEGDSGNQDVHFTIKLDQPATQDGIHVKYQTHDGTAAKNDNDYEAINPSTLTFNTGDQEKNLYVTIYGDTKVEDNETFSITLYDPRDAMLADENTSLEVTIINDDQHSSDPFVCDSNMYLSSSVKRGSSGNSGRMWLHQIDTTKNPFEFLVIDEEGDNKLYNALAYSANDNYIYGLFKKELVKISKTGKIITLGNVNDLPSIFASRQLYAGAIYDDDYYVTGPGVDYDKVFKIKLSDKSVTEITLSQTISVLDFAFTPDGKYLHGIVDGGGLVKIDAVTGDVTPIGSAHTGYQFDSSFSDANGRFFANDSLGGGFFEFNLNTGEKLFLSASQPAQFNDGANCLNAALVFTDYGDAPVSYGTPRHTIANGRFMGSNIDHDITAYNDPDALGDDLNGVDDEDGVTLLNGDDLNGSFFEPNTTQQLEITVSKDGYLNAWLDFDIDGVFDAGDKVIDAVGLTTGTHTLNINIPSTVTVNQTTYLRFRFSSTQNLTPTNNATDGEVEDYAVQFGVPFNGLKGVFNIERTDSGSYPIGSAERHAWYTQVSGRDFDYSIVFYEEDWSAEKPLSNVTLKIELINYDTNSTLYERYIYVPIGATDSRITIDDTVLPVDDLKDMPATKDALFRVSFDHDPSSGAIIQSECTGAPQSCFNAFTSVDSDPAQDHFAIRPARFYMTIADGDTPIVTSDNNTTETRLVAGYDYNISVKAIGHLSLTPLTTYNKTLSEAFPFNTDLNLTCADTTPITQNLNFTDGLHRSNDFTHDNVGHYTLEVEDSTWTGVDQSSGDCDANESYYDENDFNIRPGCNIAVLPSPIEVAFFPYQFAMDFTPNTLPLNSHSPDFLYMNDLNVSEDIALQLIGTITAETNTSSPLSNFTQGCMARDIELIVNASTLTENGLILAGSDDTIKVAASTGDDSNVSISRWVAYNGLAPQPVEDILNITEPLTISSQHFLDDANGSVEDILNITEPLTISSQHFLDDANGSLDIDLRFNLDKPITHTVNPVQFNLQDINTSSSESNASGYQQNEYIPTGRDDLENLTRNFYFAQVAPDKINYPEVIYSVSPIIRTPLNIDIFCDASSNYCVDTNVTAHTSLGGSPRKQEGWYISVDHNHTTDGSILALDSDNTRVTTVPSPTIVLPLELKEGRNGMVMTRFNSFDPNNNRATIFIMPSPHLLYSPIVANNGQAHYTVEAILNTPSQWTGVGETGNIIESNTSQNSARKIDW